MYSTKINSGRLNVSRAVQIFCDVSLSFTADIDMRWFCEDPSEGERNV